MEAAFPTTQPDPAILRTRAAWHHLIATLSAILPPPPEDTPDCRARCDNAAIAQIASLCPVNAAEATLAAQYVAANAHAMHCLGRAQAHAEYQRLANNCTARADNLLRQAQAALRLLLRTQARREKRDADPGLADQDAWTAHRAGRSMAEALSAAPPQADAPPMPSGHAPRAADCEPRAARSLISAVPAPPPHDAATMQSAQTARAADPPPPDSPETALSTPMRSQRSPAPTSHGPPCPAPASHGPPCPAPDPHSPPSPEPQPRGPPGTAPSEPPASEPPPSGGAATSRDAALYEHLYPDRADLIRRHGGVPDSASFDPPEPDLVRALLATPAPPPPAPKPQNAARDAA